MADDDTRFLGFTYREPDIFYKDPLIILMQMLTEQADFGDLLAPIQRALEQTRLAKAPGCVLSSEAFISVGVLRHLQVLRFFKLAFLKPVSPQLFDALRRPSLIAYL